MKERERDWRNSPFQFYHPSNSKLWSSHSASACVTRGMPGRNLIWI